MGRNLVRFAGLTLVGLSVMLAGPRGSGERQDFKQYFDAWKVQGSFLLYDLKNDSSISYNPAQLNQSFTPASTFKICNSLIGLETGVIRDENFVIKWDGVVRRNVEWNKDQDMKTAFANSTVPYYQELARRVGGRRMKYWLDKAHYGNADTSGGIDKFWLSGGLRINPQQQIDFLVRLYKNDLPFSDKTMDIVRRIMIAKDTIGYTIRAKTGLSDQDGKDIGWYVGYLETTAGVYFFATCIQSADQGNPDFIAARIDITMRILKSLKLL